MAAGAVAGWVPYPFLDAADQSWGAVAGVSVSITVVFIILIAAFAWADRRLPAQPAPH